MPKLPSNTEFKTFHFELKSVDEDQGLVTGYLSTFGNVDSQNDTVIKGAFKKTITEAKSRMQNGRRYLWPMLWMHDPEQPIGGYIDAEEDGHGLLVTAQLDIGTNAQGFPNNTKATMVFSGFKSGYIDEQSIGYNPIQKEYQNGIRQLKEIRLVEGSAVTMNFAANDQALVPSTGVKSMHTKGASGKTTWPLADRATKWDSGQATKDIEAWANGDWSKVAQCFFWVAQSPPAKLEDCKLPFVAKDGGTMKAIPQGIISCAGVIQGAMGGADLPSGDVDAVKTKIATYYKKMDMTPPWEDDGKRGQRFMQRKDFNDHYREECIEDWLYTDFNNLTSALRQSIIDMFTIGDSPQDDLMNTVLQDGDDSPGFISALQAFVQKGVDLGVSNYLNEIMSSYGCSSDNVMRYMSRGRANQTKVGARFSQDTTDALEQHAKDMMDTAKQYKALANQMQQKVSDLTALWRDEGQGNAYGNDSDSSSDNGKAHTRREPSTRTLPRLQAAQQNQPSKQDTEAPVTLDDLELLIASI